MARIRESPFKDGVDAMVSEVRNTEAAEVSKQCTDAAAWRATYLGHLTGLALQKLGIRPGKGDGQPLQLPAAQFLEFGAALQLALWEQGGFTAHLDAGLPPSADAFAAIAARTEQGSRDSEVIPTDSLSFDVFKLSIDEFCWDAPSILGIDVQLKADNEDDFVKLLADFLRGHLGR